MHLRRFIYRFDGEVEWQVYAYLVVAFGDCPAALALELVKQEAAKLAKDLDPLAASQLWLPSPPASPGFGQ